MPTRQQLAVLTALDEVGGFRSAQELHAMLRGTDQPVGLTTVYRALQSLAEAGEVDALRSAAGETVYRRCATAAHHHHLVCRGCGRTVEVSGPEVEAWAERTARRHGFRDVSHTVEIFGRCRECSRGSGQAPATAR